MPKHQKHFRMLQIFGSGKSIIVKPECGASCEHSLASTPIPGDRPPLQWDCDDPVSHVNHVDAGHVWPCDLPCFAEVLATACSLLPEFAKVAPSLFQTLTSAALICFERSGLEHWGSSSVIIWTQTTCSCKSLSKNPSLMNAQWSPPVWINPFCETLSHSVPECIDSTRGFMNWEQFYPPLTGLLQYHATSSVRSLNRRIEISSSWTEAVQLLESSRRSPSRNSKMDPSGSSWIHVEVENTLKHVENPSQCGFG